MIRDVVTRGYGNGTFNSTIPFTVTAGYTIGEVIQTPDSTFAVRGLIDENGQGLRGKIQLNGLGLVGMISDSFGINGNIDADGQGLRGKINSNGQGVKGEI